MEVFWYFLDGARRRQGPVDAQQVRGALHNGEIGADALIWREGMAEWKPLREVAEFADMAAAFPSARQPDAYRATSGPGTFQGQVHTTALGTAHDVVYAGFWRRWAALFLDQIMIFVPLLGLTLLFGYLGGAFRNLERDGMPKIDGLYYFLYFLISPMYYALQESGTHQATLGKRALGIKVTDENGKRISFPHALGRWLAAGLSYITLYIGFLMAAFTSEKKALHDVVAKTLVVDRWAFTNHPERQTQGMSGCLIVFVVLVVLAIPGIGILAAISIPAYHQYVQRAKGATDGNPLMKMLELRTTIEAFHQEHGRCPANGDDGIGSPESYSSMMIARIEVGDGPGGGCAMMMTMRDEQGRALDGHMMMEYLPAQGGWRCSSEGLPSAMVPPQCR